MTAEHRPNLLVILIYDLRFDEFGASGHPCMRTTHFDWLTRVLVRFDAPRRVTTEVTRQRQCVRVTLPLDSVPHSRVTNWLAWPEPQASLARTAPG